MTDEEVNRFMAGKWDTHEGPGLYVQRQCGEGMANAWPEGSTLGLDEGEGLVVGQSDAERREEMYAMLSADQGMPQMVLTSDSAARKALPLFSGLIKYFPRALAAVAKHSFVANEKHNPGEPLHWSEHKSSDHKDALTRHLFDAGTIDPEFGAYHDVGLAWRALANLETFLKKLEQQ